MSNWHEHPRLVGRFDAACPDDLQVIVHDGHPAISRRQPELAWVRLTSGDGSLFSGILLNRPLEVRGVAVGDEIRVIVPDGGDCPLMVTSDYLVLRSAWRLLAPCTGCGLTEMLSPAQVLAEALFPSRWQCGSFNFTARCGWCGGSMVVRIKRLKR
jgi:hypothetical protein